AQLPLPPEVEIIPEEKDEEDISTKALKESKPPKRVTINDNHPDQPITIGGNLSAECRTELIKVLCKHADAFAWVPRRWSVAPDRRKVVKEEVDEWFMSGIVKKVWYPTWVANSVLVKKANGSWRMCIDFKDLNKAYPKDLYPLLKNVGATYQRLVDTIFEGQIGRNLEAYVDDMVIKSKTELDLIKDTEETLLMLKKVNMKLNPKKCSFGMKEGKILRYIVTSEGIRANPKKTKAVMSMPSPSNLKQMQSLSVTNYIFMSFYVNKLKTIYFESLRIYF
ncbi:reverse transcriptase domain-containing protein, partial [Tanacetum coccineum]